jgi:hypothetical protein
MKPLTIHSNEIPEEGGTFVCQRNVASLLFVRTVNDRYVPAVNKRYIFNWPVSAVCKRVRHELNNRLIPFADISVSPCYMAQAQMSAILILLRGTLRRNMAQVPITTRSVH